MRPTWKVFACVLAFVGALVYAFSTRILITKDGDHWTTNTQYVQKKPLFSSTTLREESLSTSYRLPENCSMRANRTNPRYNPSQFSCPVDHEFGTKLHFKQRNFQYSKMNCSDSRHCSYSNVCLQPSTKTFLFFEEKPGTHNLRDFGWKLYRDSGNQVSFSWHYKSKIVDELPRGEALWADGTSIWFDQSYANFCHVGHSSEIYTKLVELRKLFPGPIQRILYATDMEPPNRPDSYHFCYIPCHEIRVAFEPEGWRFPKVFWMLHQKEFVEDKTICFENVLVPSAQHQHFTSREFVAMHRSSALKMCGIPERPTPKYPNNVFFYQRGHDRQIFNVIELCKSASDFGYFSYIETDDHPDYCQQIASMYSADIIVSVDGSHNHLLKYARPGSVLILIMPFNFRVPDWKLLGHVVGLRVLELMILNSSHSIPHPGQVHPQQNLSLSKKPIDCYTYSCRARLRHNDAYVPVDQFNTFFEYALKIWNVDNPEPCEKPLSWPVQVRKNSPHLYLWQQYGYACNYQVCEPPPPDCICCKDKDCMEAVSIERGF